MRRSEVQTSSHEAADPGRVDLCGISPCGLGDCEPAPDPGKIQHLAALLDKQGVSWRYSTPSAGSSWTRANSICQLRFSRDWSRNVVLQLTMFFRGITPRQLATAIIQTGLASDHSERSNSSGPSWVPSLANTIGNSVYCHNSVIFIIT